MSRGEAHRFVVRRVYDADASASGQAVLVDRLWPRGVAKADLAQHEWLRDVAPSTELRRWYGHDPDRFAEFRSRYLAELRQPPAAVAVQHLVELAADGVVVLLTATREVDRSGAEVLREHLDEQGHGARSPSSN